MAEGDLNKALKEALDTIKALKQEFKEVKAEAKETATAVQGITNKPGSGGALANSSTSSPPQSVAYSAPNAGAPGPGTPGQAPTPPRFSDSSSRTQLASAIKGFGSKVVQVASVAAAFLPTTQEAVTVNQLGERLRFYDADIKSKSAAYGVQNQASVMGTPTSPLDAALAGNVGARAGLLPGLPNFRAGNRFTGIMGGAALASNLNPGIGLQGGMGVMSSLNQASNVNMLRMFGVQVRNGSGSGMVDFPQIIEQLYQILARSNGGKVTREAIAVSAMSGNALDSILTQYFGNDENLRQTVLSGLVQRTASGTALGISGALTGKHGLQSTGGSTRGTQTTAARSTAELQMIQQFDDSTIRGLIGANNVLMNFYKFLGKNATNSAVQVGQGLSVGLETFAGARNGAGALATDMLFSSTGALIGKGSSFGSKAGNALFSAAMLAGAVKGGALSDSIQGPSIPITGGTQATNPGPMYTGAITINVSAPPSSDPYAFASAITQAMTART
jgi:hypothetical protein